MKKIIVFILLIISLSFKSQAQFSEWNKTELFVKGATITVMVVASLIPGGLLVAVAAGGLSVVECIVWWFIPEKVEAKKYKCKPIKRKRKFRK